ncbi:hypothetical protein Ancab_015703 [Ancistrocladus abbreviatus]
MDIRNKEATRISIMLLTATLVMMSLKLVLGRPGPPTAESPLVPSHPQAKDQLSSISQFNDGDVCWGAMVDLKFCKDDILRSMILPKVQVSSQCCHALHNLNQMCLPEFFSRAPIHLFPLFKAYCDKMNGTQAVPPAISILGPPLPPLVAPLQRFGLHHHHPKPKKFLLHQWDSFKVQCQRKVEAFQSLGTATSPPKGVGTALPPTPAARTTSPPPLDVSQTPSPALTQEGIGIPSTASGFPQSTPSPQGASSPSLDVGDPPISTQPSSTTPSTAPQVPKTPTPSPLQDHLRSPSLPPEGDIGMPPPSPQQSQNVPSPLKDLPNSPTSGKALGTHITIT